MQTNPTPPKNGFTLIELLVVISIIALLASIAVPTGNIVIRKARIAQAKSHMAGLVLGIKGYQTEYNRFPQVGGGGNNASDVEPIELSSGNSLLPVLMANPNQTPNELNPRNVNFYDPPPAKGNSAGYTKDGALVDPWTHPYSVVFDSNGDGMVTIPDDVKLDSDPATLTTTVISYSKGPDNRDGGNKKNYVTTWR